MATLGVFDPDMPWDAVFLAAANDSEFWTTEVAETALLYIARVKDKDDLTDLGHHVQVVGAAPGFGLGSGGGGFPPQPPALTKAHQKAAAAATATKKVTEDANKFVVTAGALGEQQRQGRRQRQAAQGTGASLCVESGRGKVPTRCPNGRVQQCEVCGASDHKGKDCPRACELWGCAEECVVVDRSDVVVDGEDRFSSAMAEEIADKV